MTDPYPADQRWAEMKQILRAELSRNAVGQQAADWICADLRERFLRCDLLYCAIDHPGASESMKAQIHTAATALFNEVFHLEIALYRAKFPEPSEAA
jgi:hypothetical protein